MCQDGRLQMWMVTEITGMTVAAFSSILSHRRAFDGDVPLEKGSCTMVVFFCFADGFEESGSHRSCRLLPGPVWKLCWPAWTDSQVTTSHTLTVVADCVMDELDPRRRSWWWSQADCRRHRLNAHARAKAGVHPQGGGRRPSWPPSAGPTVLSGLGLLDGVEYHLLSRHGKGGWRAPTSARRPGGD